MELLYLWIESYNNIHNQEFHFTNDYKIHFDYGLKKLEISKNSTQSFKLFDEAFLNVTAIIGKNGSGKTNLFSFIKKLFSDDFKEYLIYLMVLKDQNDQIIVSNKSRKILSEIKDSKGTSWNSIDIDDNFSLLSFVDLIVSGTGFSIYETSPRIPRYYDLSMKRKLEWNTFRSNEIVFNRIQKLIIDYQKKEIDEKTFNSYKDEILFNTKPTTLLYNQELTDCIDFISFHEAENLDFIPNQIDVAFNVEFYLNNKNYFTQIGLSSKLPLINDIIFEDLLNPSQIENVRELFKKKLTVYLFLYFSIADQNYHPTDERLRETIEKIEKYGTADNILMIITDYLTSSTNKYQGHPLKKINDFMLSIDQTFNSFQDIMIWQNNYYHFPLNKGVRDSFKLISEIWLDADSLFLYSWRGLSAGESALLSIFSRMQPIKNNPILKKSIWFMLDEGDLYLHPEWQRAFFNDLHKYLPKIFKINEIQLFLTSHSPFFVSDIPKENIILLDKVDGQCKVLDKTNFPETFGANIHELLAHSFFLKNGMIGEFAKNKIQDVIKYLKYNPNVLASEKNIKPVEDWTKERVEGFINTIGEPLIADRLQRLFDEKYKAKEDIQKRIASLQEELKKIDNETN